MLEFRRAGVVTLMAAAGLTATPAPAAADTAVCELNGPVSVAYEQFEPFIFDRGYAYVRSEGDIRCAGTLGGAIVSTQPVPYALRGHIGTLGNCSLAQDGDLRLDARIPRLISIGAEPEALTADLTPSGWRGAGSITGIGGIDRSSLDIRGSILQTAGWCESGTLHMRLTFSDGDSRPNRAGDEAEASSPVGSTAPKAKAKPRKVARKRCAKKAKRTRKAGTPRRCGTRVARKS